MKTTTSCSAGRSYAPTSRRLRPARRDTNPVFPLRRSNDIALIRLASPVGFSDTVAPACLPDEGLILPHGAPCYVTGWGRLSSESPPLALGRIRRSKVS